MNSNLNDTNKLQNEGFRGDKATDFALKQKNKRKIKRAPFYKNSNFASFVSKYSKALRLLLAILLFYNLQFVVNQHIKIDNYLPNFNFILIAACTVYMDSGITFIVSAMLAIMIESTYKSVPLIDLLSYPTISLILAQFLGNKHERIKKQNLFSDRESLRINIDKERKYYKQIQTIESQGKISFQGGEILSGILLDFKKIIFSIKRAFSTNYVLDAVLLHLIYEIIMLVYVLLNGSSLKWHHIQNMLGSVIYTSVLSIILLPIIKKILGISTKDYDD